MKTVVVGCRICLLGDQGREWSEWVKMRTMISRNDGAASSQNFQQQPALVRARKIQQVEQTVASDKIGPAKVDWFQWSLDGLDGMKGGGDLVAQETSELADDIIKQEHHPSNLMIVSVRWDRPS